MTGKLEKLDEPCNQARERAWRGKIRVRCAGKVHISLLVFIVTGPVGGRSFSAATTPTSRSDGCILGTITCVSCVVAVDMPNLECKRDRQCW